MDAHRFDGLARSLSNVSTRRRVAALAAGTGLAVALPAEATKKKGTKPLKKKCKNGLVKCRKACVDTQTNAKHCGGCNQLCPTDAPCVGGRCQTTGGCPANQQPCAGECVDTQVSNVHCGGCDNACHGDLTCLAGLCGCANGDACGDSCVDRQSDTRHCGDCDTRCAAGETCDAGHCVPSCDSLCPGDRGCYQGRCLCEIGTLQCLETADPHGQYCIAVPERPGLGWCDCPAGWRVCAAGEGCSNKCSSEECRTDVEPGLVIGPPPEGRVAARECCWPTGSVSISYRSGYRCCGREVPSPISPIDYFDCEAISSGEPCFTGIGCARGRCVASSPGDLYPNRCA